MIPIEWVMVLLFWGLLSGYIMGATIERVIRYLEEKKNEASSR